jgi:hypothetical protein
VLQTIRIAVAEPELDAVVEVAGHPDALATE